MLLLSVVVSAQTENPLFPKSTTKHLRVAMSASASTAKKGDRLSLFVDVSPNPGIHVYAPGANDYQVITIKIDPDAGVTAGKTVYPKAETLLFEPLNERVPVFQRPFRLALPVTFTKAPKEGKTAMVSGTLAYQACDDKVCYRPESVPVSWTLTVN